MNRKSILSLTLSALVLVACGSTSVQTLPEVAVPTQAESRPTENPTATTIPPTEAPAADGGVSFANDVMPIFDNSCIGCHGGDQTRAGLDMKTYDTLMAGSVNGAVIVPGDPAESWLVKVVVDGKMPKRGDKLTPEQIQLISDWVAAGALNN